MNREQSIIERTVRNLGIYTNSATVAKDYATLKELKRFRAQITSVRNELDAEIKALERKNEYCNCDHVLGETNQHEEICTVNA